MINVNGAVGLRVATLCVIVILLMVSSIPGKSPTSAPMATIAISTGEDIIANDGKCSLREAIIAANTNKRVGNVSGECTAGSGRDTIHLDSGVYSLSIRGDDNEAKPGPGGVVGVTPVPEIGDLDISDSLTIEGSGALSTTIQAGLTVSEGVDRIFEVSKEGLQVIVTKVTLRHGRSEVGSALLNRGSNVRVIQALVTHNSSSNDARGPAVLNTVGSIDSRDMGMMTIVDSAIVDNLGEWPDGGVANYHGDMDIVNSVISGNSGAVFNGGTLNLRFVTMAHNLGGLYAALNSQTEFRNSVVAENARANCEILGTVKSLGYNIDSDGSCKFTGVGDESRVDVLVGVLAWLPNLLPAHLLLQGSPALDRIPVSECVPRVDQFGNRRPVPGNGKCDAGSIEMVTPALPTPEPTALPSSTDTPSASPTIIPTISTLTLTPTQTPKPSETLLPVTVQFKYLPLVQFLP